MEDVFWKNGISFLCTRCSACCRYDQGFVFLYEQDIAPILKKLNLKYEDFVSKYCRWISFNDGYEYLSFNEKKNYDCTFWNNGCSIYEVRPLQCKSYPFWPQALKSLDAWLALTAGCKAIINLEKYQSKKNGLKTKLEKISDKIVYPSSKNPDSENADADIVEVKTWEACAEQINKTSREPEPYFFSAEKILEIRNEQLKSKRLRREVKYETAFLGR